MQLQRKKLMSDVNAKKVRPVLERGNLSGRTENTQIMPASLKVPVQM